MVSLLSISAIERELLVNHDLVLRAVTEADQPFLFQLYACTRKEELAIVPWSEEQKQTFLEFQFNAQRTFYQRQFKDAYFWVIESVGVSLGQLYLDQRADEIRIIDIALMPAYRERGIGTTLLKAILAAGRTNKHPVTIHVECNNRALNLYRRLGFTQRGEESVYYLMEWAP